MRFPVLRAAIFDKDAEQLCALPNKRAKIYGLSTVGYGSNPYRQEKACTPAQPVWHVDCTFYLQSPVRVRPNKGAHHVNIRRSV